MSYECEKIFASLPKTERGKSIVLGADPKGKTFLYVNGLSVVIRNIEDPSESDVYTQHSLATTVAKYSPSGYYIASADISGKVRIWDTTQKEHILKNEFQPFAGPIKDLSWSSDNQRIVVGGEGKERFGAVFNSETGTSTGEIMGMSRAINSVDFKSSRPFRIVTAGEDATSCFFEGPPFKMKTIQNNHSNFVNSARYSPNGDFYATGGADGKIFLYDGKTGDLIGEIGSPAHKGGIYSLCFSPDSKELVSVSGDKTIKVWSVDEPRQMVREHALENQVNNMQLGCLWVNDHILSVALAGHILVFKADDLSQPERVISGHNKPITSMAYSAGAARIVTGSMDGGVGVWDPLNGDCQLFSGAGHSNQVQQLGVEGDTVVTVGIDDKLIVSSLQQMSYGSDIQLSSQPRDVCISNGLVGVACIKEVMLVHSGRPVASLPVSYEPEAVAISTDSHIVAVGGKQDNSIHLYSVAPGSYNLNATGGPTKMDGPVTALAFSPAGGLLAAADADRKVSLFTVTGPGGDGPMTPAHNEYWRFHTARVNCLAFSPDGQRLASGALDTWIIVWSVAEPKKRIIIKNAHPTSQITSLCWLDNNTLLSCGQDSNIRKWKVSD